MRLISDRVYLQPKDMVFDTMLDLMELQRGEEILSDPIRGELHFRIVMYGQTWGIRFSVVMIDMTRCAVKIEIEETDESIDDSNEKSSEDMVRREYALLDSMLISGKPYFSEGDRDRSARDEKQSGTSGKKNFLQPPDMLLNAIHDMAGLQKGRTVLCDSPHGIIRFKVTVYGIEREYRFTVHGIGGSRCSVTIDLEGDGPEIKRLIDHEFALLEYVLMDRTKLELSEIEEYDKYRS